MTGSLLALIAATGVLVAIPGPNVALIVASSIRYGLRSGLVTVAGTTTGFALQLYGSGGAGEPAKSIVPAASAATKSTK
jgi:threonine/homoserine/homoserine lactone efflux protein